MQESDEAVAAEPPGPAMEWLQREARLEDWDEQLAELDGEIAALEFAESEARDELRVRDGEDADGGSLREVGEDLIVERDQLKRRIEMERSTVRRALGEERHAATSFRYDEWDYHNGAYLRGWCRLFEDRLAAEEAQSQELVDAVRPFARAVRRQFEQVRPAGYQRVKKTPDGDEIDLDAVIQTRADIRTGVSPDERVYSRRERLRRDVAAAFLVDLSASTDDILPEEHDEPPSPSPPRPNSSSTELKMLYRAT
jgi:nitric oxide reductase activation protein